MDHLDCHWRHMQLQSHERKYSRDRFADSLHSGLHLSIGDLLILCIPILSKITGLESLSDLLIYANAGRSSGTGRSIRRSRWTS